ncbi:DUF4442 domain-containing protein [Shewanella surugensis]|uniref:DUF4442 domain-containing protein n=1 Tax=Shewanella surugensis TaxID=212020 RepID=A0ABT0LDT9_9GAMM|nr:DUF4442 domain-containing protein [Shewanella surugensis]MCL1125857.1 DUF4442 domain-containing protein [Shewanella surugensis]
MKSLLSKSVFFKWAMNAYPPYLFTGISIKQISQDYRKLTVVMPLRWYNRNYVGTHFGGNLFAMTDPWFMLMLIQILGRDFKVWDQSANIEFIKPGKGRVSCDFCIGDELLQHIYQATEKGDKYLPELVVDIKDETGEVVAKVKKIIYIRRKQGR